MGRLPSIDETTGQQLLDAYQRLGSKAAAAREAGVSESAARRYFEGLPEAAAPSIAAQRQIVETAGASLWETRAALDENYQRTLDLVLMAQALDMANPKAVAAATGVFREIRAHIESSLTLVKLLIDVDEVKKFQQAVLEAIAEADEPTRQRIIQKLRERRAVGLALSGG